MRFGLISLIALLNLSTLANAQSPAANESTKLSLPSTSPTGYLLIPQDNHNVGEAFQATPYYPQPGDIILYDEDNRLYHAVFKLVGTNAPTHTAMVIARSDGTPGLLDIMGGMVMTLKVAIIDVMPRLTEYPGAVMVRRLRKPLTPEQSRNMTCFAQSQVGKGFALGRVLMFATPLNPLPGNRPRCSYSSDFNRKRWYCSEMVVAAGIMAQIFDPCIHRPHGTRPRDLAYDETMDLSDRYLPPATWVADWHPTLAGPKP